MNKQQLWERDCQRTMDFANKVLFNPYSPNTSFSCDQLAIKYDFNLQRSYLLIKSLERAGMLEQLDINRYQAVFGTIKLERR